MSDIDRFDRAIEELLADRSPHADAERLDPEEQRMLRMAQMLRGSQSGEPDPEFVDRLHGELFPAPVKVSRRTAFLTGLGALAAGIVGGFGLERAAQPSASPAAWVPLVGKNGKWTRVAALADVPEGAIHPFVAGGVQGFLIHKDGKLRAMSRICTHMGCALNANPAEKTLVCPCHGAEFDLNGRLRYGPKQYNQKLPPLPPLKVRVTGEAVEVWGA